MNRANFSFLVLLWLGCTSAFAASPASPSSTGASTLSSADSGSNAQGIVPARGPLGVYAKVDIESAIEAYSGPPGELHSYLRGLYAGLLADPAVSGIAVGRHWDKIELSAGNDGYDWSYLDDAFAEAAAARKAVQLLITPGFDTPQWVLAQITPCDSLFSSGTAPSDCGSMTFAGFPEQQFSDGSVLPLPWNPIYQSAWRNFLVHLNARYGSNPLFNSIAIAGPVGASTEMIYPTNDNTTATQPSGLPVDTIWKDLIANAFPAVAGYQGTDQVFIDQWDLTVNMYESVFSGITLFLTPDSGIALPNFSSSFSVHPDNTLYAQDCSALPDMSCEAKTEVLSYFVTVRGPNGKATHLGGMTASNPDTLGNIGIAGVKLLDSLFPPPVPRFVGGAEFDFPVSSANLQQEGCPTYRVSGDCPNLTVEEGAYYVLTVFFNQTPVGILYGGSFGDQRIEYLDVPYLDVQYAESHPCPMSPSPIIGETSLQDLLNGASFELYALQGLLEIPLPRPTCNE